MVELRLEIEEPPTPESRQRLVDRLLGHFAEEFGDPQFRSVGLFLRSGEDELAAGLIGRMRWGWLYVETLWVARHLRGTGLGSRLLQEAERYARAHGGVAAHLECGVDALRFYERRGYEVVGIMDGFPVHADRQHHLRKWLGP
ncbi:MAG: GNAT family N-acetyltransferase [Gemmatimonadales bacterium]